MKKLALALMAASAALFGVSAVASAQSGYEPAVSVDPGTVAPGESYTVTYTNCFVGESVGFSQPDSTPTNVVSDCEAVGTPAVTSSIIGLLLPQGNQITYGVATAEFAAPMEPGPYEGAAESRSGNLPWT